MTASVRTSASSESEHRLEIARALNAALQGRLGVVRAMTIANATTSTIVADALAHPGSVPFLVPTNAAAAAISPYVTARAAGSFTLAHANPGASATFLYILLG